MFHSGEIMEDAADRIDRFRDAVDVEAVLDPVEFSETAEMIEMRMCPDDTVDDGWGNISVRVENVARRQFLLQELDAHIRARVDQDPAVNGFPGSVCIIVFREDGKTRPSAFSARGCITAGRTAAADDRCSRRIACAQ